MLNYTWSLSVDHPLRVTCFYRPDHHDEDLQRQHEEFFHQFPKTEHVRFDEVSRSARVGESYDKFIGRVRDGRQIIDFVRRDDDSH